jgi:hypothetical protein
MSEKVSLKIFIVISFLCGILYACMVPVDIQTFMEDDEVQKVIELTKKQPPSVKIHPDSDEGLKAGNGKISGLDRNKYYKIEEMEGDDPKETYFVTSGGKLGAYLRNIGKVSNGEITELENDVTYRVKSAISYTNSDNKIQYFNLTYDTETKKVPVENGIVNILESRTNNCYFDLSTTINARNYYEVMRVSRAGDNPTWTWAEERTSAYRKSTASANVTSISSGDYDNNYVKFNEDLDIGIFEHDTRFITVTPNFLNEMSIMRLPALNSENDYVFVGYEGTPAVTNSDFYYLTVKVSPAPTSGGVDVIITPPTPLADLILTPSPIGDIITISISGSPASRTITVSGGDTYTWYCNDRKPISIIPTISVLGDQIEIGTTTPTGSYMIIVEGTVGGAKRSKWFILKVT